MPDEVKALSSSDKDLIAEFIRGEKQDRKNARKDLERQWKEVDRQLEGKREVEDALRGV